MEAEIALIVTGFMFGAILGFLGGLLLERQAHKELEDALELKTRTQHIIIAELQTQLRKYNIPD